MPGFFSLRGRSPGSNASHCFEKVYRRRLVSKTGPKPICARFSRNGTRQRKFFHLVCKWGGRMLGTRVNLMPLFAKTLTWRPKLAMALHNVVHITRKNHIA
jgi:hypothetical protein